MLENELEKYIRKDIPLEFNEFEVLKEQLSRIVSIYEKNVLPPYELLIHSSSICNLNCKWCIGSFVSRKKCSKDLLENNLTSLDNMKKIVSDIIAFKQEGIDIRTGKRKIYGIERVSFSGITGEPLVAKESILYAIESLSSVGIKVGVFTNGTLITEDMFDTLLKLKYILISIDAGSSETYSKLKCNSKNDKVFEKLITTIEKLIDAKKRNNSKTEINVGYIINQYNYNEVYDLAIKLKKIGVHYLRIKTDIASILNMNEVERIKAKKNIERIKKELCDEAFGIVEIHNILNDSEKKRKFNKCFIHYMVGNISSDGKLYPCNYHPRIGGHNYGSLLHNSFSDIWKNMLVFELDKNIPQICPKVCDPFKNRANRLLEVAYNIYKNKGLDYLIQCIDDINKKYYEV